MSAQQQNLCAICQKLDIQKLLLAAASSNCERPKGRSFIKTSTVHAALPAFFPHQPDLAHLKRASDSCALCSAIWRDFCRQREASELTETALARGLGKEQVFVGTTDWDTSINALPTVAVRQQSFNDGVQRHRQLACFEVCADYGAY